MFVSFCVRYDNHISIFYIEIKSKSYCARIVIIIDTTQLILTLNLLVYISDFGFLLLLVLVTGS